MLTEKEVNFKIAKLISMAFMNGHSYSEAYEQGLTLKTVMKSIGIWK